MDAEAVLEKRKGDLINKVFQKFKSPYDSLALLALAAFAVFRYYLLFKTKGQALWWDEGTYFVQARHWALGTPEYFEPARDWFVSFIWAIFIKIGFNEFALRFLTVTAGIVFLYFFYLIVCYFFGKKVGLISLVLASVFYEPIFWSLRLDIGTYSILFMLVSLFFFIKGVSKNNNLYYFLLATAFAVFSLNAHAPGILIILFYIIFIPIYTKFKFYKSKKFWICLLFFFLIFSPFLIKNVISTGQIYPRYQIGWFERTGEGNSLVESLVYVTSLPGLIGIVSFTLFLIGLFLSLDIFLILDKIFKGEISKINTGKIFFLLFGLISLALGIQSLLGPGGAYFEARYTIPFYFMTFVFAGIGIDFVSSIIKKYSKILSVLFIIILLGFVSYNQLNQASDLTIMKSQSYQGIKQAGLWIGENSNSEDKIITFEPPQITYYSNRKCIGMRTLISEVKEDIKDNKPRYMLLWAGGGQKRITELQSFAEENKEDIIPRSSFPVNNQQPTVLVYEILDSYYQD